MSGNTKKSRFCRSGSLADWINARSTLDGDGDVFAARQVTVGTDYQVRVRACRQAGPRTGLPAAASAFFRMNSADAPTPVGAIPGAIPVAFPGRRTIPNKQMEIWAAAVDDAGFAALLAGPVYGAANGTRLKPAWGLQ